MKKHVKRWTAALLSAAMLAGMTPLMSLTAHAASMDKGSYLVDMSVFDAEWEESEKNYEDFKAMEESLRYMSVNMTNTSIDLDRDGKIDIIVKKDGSVVTYQAASTRSKDLFVLKMTAQQEQNVNDANDYEHPYYTTITFNFKANQGSATLDLRNGPAKITPNDLKSEAIYRTFSYLFFDEYNDDYDPNNPYISHYDLDNDGSYDMIADTSKKQWSAMNTRSTTKKVFKLSANDKLSIQDWGGAYYENLTVLLPTVTGKTKITSLVNANKGFKLVWNKVSGAAGYEVWRSETGGKYLRDYTKARTVVGGSTTTYTNSADAANKNGTKYYYMVIPYKAGGRVGEKYYFPRSNVRVTYKVATPAAPSVVNATEGFKISWKKNSKATGYEIYRSADNGKTYTKAKTITSGSTTTFNNTADAANKNGVKYKYKIRAFKTVGGVQYNSAMSPIKVSYKVATPAAPTLSNVSNGIKVTWKKNSKASGYIVYRSEDGGKSYIKAKTIKSASTTSFVNSAANKKGKTYKYKIKAFKTVSGVNYNSADSPVKSITRK